MNKKCPACSLVNFSGSEICSRCGARLSKSTSSPSASTATDDANALERRLNAGVWWFCKRLATAVLMSLILVVAAYLTMLYSAAPLSAEQQKQVDEAVALLDARGFKSEAGYLRWAAFRANDNWFNLLTGHADAYAATNFPFQIITLYDEFFTESRDSTERAAILLHEAQHLTGAGEPFAYGHVWRNRSRLGWTADVYGEGKIYRNVLKSTKTYTPFLFRCEWNKNADCTD